jgi:hypothetical protein
VLLAKCFRYRIRQFAVVRTCAAALLNVCLPGTSRHVTGYADRFEFDLGCVKTCERDEAAELFSLLSSPDVGVSVFAFSIDEAETKFLFANPIFEFSYSQDPIRTSEGCCSRHGSGKDLGRACRMFRERSAGALGSTLPPGDRQQAGPGPPRSCGRVAWQRTGNYRRVRPSRERSRSSEIRRRRAKW